tara:strand:+ start:225 stop:437 length:213 start_codon:yes stop_codon:yes gene_type:complete
MAQDRLLIDKPQAGEKPKLKTCDFSQVCGDAIGFITEENSHVVKRKQRGANPPMFRHTQSFRLSETKEVN